MFLCNYIYHDILSILTVGKTVDMIVVDTLIYIEILTIFTV